MSGLQGLKDAKPVDGMSDNASSVGARELCEPRERRPERVRQRMQRQRGTRRSGAGPYGKADWGVHRQRSAAASLAKATTNGEAALRGWGLGIREKSARSVPLSACLRFWRHTSGALHP
jgi:hypothetical protein